MIFSKFNKQDKGSGATLIRTLKLILLVLAAPGLLFAVGCDDSSSSGSDTGTLSMYMSDSVTNNFDAVYVTIDEVAVHLAEDQEGGNQADENSEQNGEWKIVSNPQKTYNLLELINGAMAELGTKDLETGHYTQIRLILGEAPDNGTNINNMPHPHPNYVITKDGTAEELKVPSGYQTGIKLVHGFDMVAGQTAELVLDFDANRSVVVTGNEKYLLKPTIKVLETLDYPLIKGVVTDAAEDKGLADVVVSAQKVDSEGNPEVFTSTITSEGENGAVGAYQMYLPEGSYYIVAYKDGVEDQGAAAAYGPSCKKIQDLRLNTVYGGNDFNLDLSKTGDINVNLTLPETSEESDVATIRILKKAPCSDGDEQIEQQIEVLSESFAETGDYTITVPGSDTGINYTVTASYDGSILDQPVTVETASASSATATFDFTE